MNPTRSELGQRITATLFIYRDDQPIELAVEGRYLPAFGTDPAEMHDIQAVNLSGEMINLTDDEEARAEEALYEQADGL